MRLALLLSLMAFGVPMFAAAPVAAAPEGRVRLARAAADAERLVQPRQRARPQARSGARPRAQIRVYSRYPYRRYHSIYPLPYDIEYPGPHAVRHCVNHYAVEWRPSGDVVVPRMRCWWAPG